MTGVAPIVNPAVRVVIVDDSATIRALIRHALASRDDLTVVGEAGDPLEARRVIRETAPDVITLDVEMPNMNGLEFLERLMRLRPMPVVMVSTLTQRGAEVTLAALELGAVECVAKPTSPEGFRALAGVVAMAARARVGAGRETLPVRMPADGWKAGRRALVAIGASTGGVEALLTLVSTLPPTCPPTLITQHMPAPFTPGFAARLDRATAARVREAEDGLPLDSGQILLAPGGARHMSVERRAGRWVCRLTEGEAVNGHRPSVDVLFGSVAAAAGPEAIGVILTGMGRDGAEGLMRIRQAGGLTLGQDEATCVVYGMPRVAHEIGAVARQLPLSRVGHAILSATDATVKGAA